MAELRRIDPERWPRAAHYRHFTEDCPCSVSLADDIDVTELKNSCASSGGSFYLSVLWLVSAAVNAHEEFRMAETDSPDDPRESGYPGYDPVMPRTSFAVIRSRSP